jgi:hypothetical protein
MSSSFRKGTRGLTVLRLAALALLVGAPGVWAQQTLFLPGFESQAEWNSNRELSPSDKESRTGYRATLEARIRRLTPRSDTQLRPQISYQKVTGRSDLDSVEAKLDLRSRYNTLKGSLSTLGRFRRQDVFNAELGRASFDDGDPETPDDVESGVISGGITRTSAQLQPNFSYSVTERTDIEGSVRYDYVNYDSNLPRERVGYSSPSVDFQIVRELSERLRLGIGPYYSHYKADDDSSESDSYGAMVNLRWKTSEVTRSTLRIRGERNKDIDLDPVRIEDTATAWGVEWVGVRENRVGSTEYRIGRFLQPTSLGGRREVDQFQVQLDRPLSHRTLLRGAIRYTRANEISDLDTGGEGGGRDQAQGDFMLRHFFTESFFVSGGYRFAWVDREATGSAENNSVFLSIGLRAKDPTGGFQE